MFMFPVTRKLNYEHVVEHKNRSIIKKRLHLIIIRTRIWVKNLHNSKININFARFFGLVEQQKLLETLKIVHFAKRS